MIKNNINPTRKVAKDFTKTPLTTRLGPQVEQSQSKTPLQDVIDEGNVEISYNDWQVMDQFDEGLRQALIKWVDTTKEGKQVLNPTGSTRSKTINFQFYGNPSNDLVGAGDIGEFKLGFKYTRKIVSPQSVSSSNNILTR
tara:strand:+ start:494 stop:913 length:420 start_codon:yes stop_codon:yes gene_type:complete